jgi:hypothetical protein
LPLTWYDNVLAAFLANKAKATDKNWSKPVAVPIPINLDEMGRAEMAKNDRRGYHLAYGR